MTLAFGILIGAIFIVVMALSLDGILPQAPLRRMADFPLKGAPATNGVLFGLTLGLILLGRIVF